MFIADPGSRIQDSDFFPSPDPGVEKAPDPGSGAATLHFGISPQNRKYAFSRGGGGGREGIKESMRYTGGHGCMYFGSYVSLV